MKNIVSDLFKTVKEWVGENDYLNFIFKTGVVKPVLSGGSYEDYQN